MEGVNILIAVGHAGYHKDVQIAEQVPDIDLVVGGHTNTFLWNGNVLSCSIIEEREFIINKRIMLLMWIFCASLTGHLLLTRSGSIDWGTHGIISNSSQTTVR